MEWHKLMMACTWHKRPEIRKTCTHPINSLASERRERGLGNDATAEPGAKHTALSDGMLHSRPSSYRVQCTPQLWPPRRSKTTEFSMVVLQFSVEEAL